MVIRVEGRFEFPEDGTVDDAIAAWHQGQKLAIRNLDIDQVWLDYLLDQTTEIVDPSFQQYYFWRCTFTGPINLDHRTIAAGLSFQFCTFEDDLSITDATLKTTGFNECVFNGDLDLSRTHWTFQLGISPKSITGTVTLDHTSYGDGFGIAGVFDGPFSMRHVSLGPGSNNFHAIVRGPTDLTGLRTVPGSKLNIQGPIVHAKGGKTIDAVFQGPLTLDDIEHHAEEIRIRTPEPDAIKAWETAIEIGDYAHCRTPLNVTIGNSTGPTNGHTYHINGGRSLATIINYLGNDIIELRAERTDLDLAIEITVSTNTISVTHGDQTKHIDRHHPDDLDQIIGRRTLNTPT